MIFLSSHSWRSTLHPSWPLRPDYGLAAFALLVNPIQKAHIGFRISKPRTISHLTWSDFAEVQPERSLWIPWKLSSAFSRLDPWIFWTLWAKKAGGSLAVVFGPRLGRSLSDPLATGIVQDASELSELVSSLLLRYSLHSITSRIYHFTNDKSN
jgi:hypothetical protein